MASNEPLMSCGLLPDWLRQKRIYSVDTFDDNLCAWRCLAIYKRKDERPTKLVDFEGIAKHHNVNIMLYEFKEDGEKDAGSIWRLVYGKIQYKNKLPTVNMGLFGGHSFYIKKT